ncbi:hypothetical protein BJ742DRAFT_31129 [Cladochytrium replicatum]|nr:hypothetical protein BJ742DRAFT_31129 [Cladochytrium replicatum]
MNGRRTGRRLQHTFHKGSAMESTKWVLCRPIEIIFLYWDYAPMPTDIREHDDGNDDKAILPVHPTTQTVPTSSILLHNELFQNERAMKCNLGKATPLAPKDGESAPLRSSSELLAAPLSPQSIHTANLTDASQRDAPVQLGIPSLAPSKTGP